MSIPANDLPNQISIERWDYSGYPNETWTSYSYMTSTKRDPWEERWYGWPYNLRNTDETMLNGRYWFDPKKPQSHGMWIIGPSDATTPLTCNIGLYGTEHIVAVNIHGSIFGIPVTDPCNAVGSFLSSWLSEDGTGVPSTEIIFRGVQRSPLRGSDQKLRAGTDSSVSQALEAITEIKGWLNLNLDETVSLCNLSVRTVQYWQNGTTQIVRPRTVRKLFQVHGVVQMLVEKLGREKARQWLNMPSETGRGRLEVLSCEEGAPMLLREATADLFEVAPRPERPILEQEPDPEVDLDALEDRSQSKGGEVKVRRPRKVSQFGH